MSGGRDDIYSRPFDKISAFRFDTGVVEVFEDMIERSVPGYAAIVGMTGELARQFAQPNSFIYDLGCSLGAGSLAMASQPLPSGLSIKAVDNSPAMLSKLCERLALRPSGGIPIELIESSIEDLDLGPCSFVVLNFTLQFIDPAQRDRLIARIHKALLPGGALLLSEKIRIEDGDSNQLITELHHGFKRAMGYSDLEIAQKRASLERVLIPETSEQHLARMRTSGFTQACTWFQCFNFCSFLGVKA